MARPLERLCALAMVGSVVVAWLPWVRSGQAVRNSYGALRSAQRLGLEELTPFRVVWFVLPVVAFAAIVAGLAGRQRLLGLLSLVVGVVLIGAGIWVAMTTVTSHVGVWASIVVGCVAVGSGGFLAWRPQAVEVI